MQSLIGTEVIGVLKQTLHSVMHLAEHKTRENNKHYFGGIGLFIGRGTTLESYTNHTLRSADKKGREFKKNVAKIPMY